MILVECLSGQILEHNGFHSLRMELHVHWFSIKELPVKLAFLLFFVCSGFPAIRVSVSVYSEVLQVELLKMKRIHCLRPEKSFICYHCQRKSF